MDIKFILDILTHILILLGVLSLLFWNFVFKKEENDINQKLKLGISQFFNDIKKTVNEDQKYSIRSQVKKYDKEIQILESTYSKPDQTIKCQNKSLLNLNLFLIAIVGLIIITSLFILKLVCKYRVNYLDLLKSNVISFLFLGVIEFFFFKFILSKYVSIKPGYVYDKIQNSF